MRVQSKVVEVVNKRLSSDYQQISGYIPKDIALKFKSLAMLNDVNISDAVEQAVKLWIKENSQH